MKRTWTVALLFLPAVGAPSPVRAEGAAAVALGRGGHPRPAPGGPRRAIPPALPAGRRGGAAEGDREGQRGDHRPADAVRPPLRPLVRGRRPERGAGLEGGSRPLG